MTEAGSAGRRAEATALREVLQSLGARVQKHTLVSPVDARVSRIFRRNPGEAVRGGDVILEVTPSDGALVFGALLAPADVAAVRVGQQAKITLSAFLRDEVLPVDGTVIFVSPAATPDEKGQPHYFVRISTTVDKVKSKSGWQAIQPGMTAQINIIAGERSVLSYLLSPFLRVASMTFTER